MRTSFYIGLILLLFLLNAFLSMDSRLMDWWQENILAVIVVVIVFSFLAKLSDKNFRK